MVPIPEARTQGAQPPGSDRKSDAAAVRTGLVARLRAAGCVFAEEEADILLESAGHDVLRLDRLVTARAEGVPLESLVGWVGFAGLRLAVGPGVFVPRQRTLHLLDLTRQELRRPTRTRPRTFVEAFAGVAPLATAVSAEMPEIRVLASDRDRTARGYAAINLGERGAVCASNVLDGIPDRYRGDIDVIAAVPPYVPEGAIALLPREAREHEPRRALLGGRDGLRWVRRLISEASEWIAPGGVLLIELSEGQLEAAVRYGRACGWRHEPTRRAEASLTTVLALRADGRARCDAPHDQRHDGSHV